MQLRTHLLLLSMGVVLLGWSSGLWAQPTPTNQDTQADIPDEFLQLFVELHNRVAELELANEDLREQVAELAKDVSELKSMIVSQPAVLGPDDIHILRVESIQPYEPVKEQAEIDRIKNEIKNLPRPSSSEGGSSRSTRQQRDYERAVREKEDQIRLIQRQISIPRYWILGWDGKQDVMVFTNRDESDILLRMNEGEFVAWKGDIVDRQVGHAVYGNYELWRADGIKVVQRPKPFVDRPESMIPLWSPDRFGETAFQSEVDRFPRLPDDG